MATLRYAFQLRPTASSVMIGRSRRAFLVFKDGPHATGLAWYFTRKATVAVGRALGRVKRRSQARHVNVRVSSG